MHAGGDVIVAHLPSPHEFVNSMVTIRASAPEGLPMARSNYGTVETRRERTRAAAALGHTINRMRALGIAHAGIMPKSKGAPRLAEYQPAAYEQAPLTVARAEAAEAIGPVGGKTVPVKEHRGSPLGVTMHHSPEHGPKLIRARNIESVSLHTPQVEGGEESDSGDRGVGVEPVPVAAPQ
jgi:hypothetical protein